MRKIIFLLFSFSSFVHAQSSAVDALKQYIPIYEHSGVNGLGQSCSIDMYSRSGSVMIELVTPRFSKFLVTHGMVFESRAGFLRISAEPVSENEGIVTSSLIFAGREVYLERKYCKDDRCWNSATNGCQLDPW